MSKMPFLFDHKRVTEAQERALDWLPEDGSYRMKPGRLAAAIDSLCLGHNACVYGWGDFGPRGGRAIRWQITEKGKRMKAALAEHRAERGA